MILQHSQQSVCFNIGKRGLNKSTLKQKDKCSSFTKFRRDVNTEQTQKITEL